ncbi:hypothetical protein [Arthrobacter tecti]
MKKLSVSLTTAAIGGALTLPRPADWSRATQRAIVVLPSVALAAGAAVVLSRDTTRSMEDGTEEKDKVKLPVPARVAIALGLGAAACGASALGLRLDAWMERQLSGRGLAHPRRWMAAGAAVLYLALDLVDTPERERPAKH